MQKKSQHQKKCQVYLLEGLKYVPLLHSNDTNSENEKILCYLFYFYS